MDSDAVFARCAVLRREIADLVDTLDETQLATPSLCGKWDVRTVAAHLTVLATTSLPTFVVAMLRSAGSFDKANDALSRKAARATPAEIAATLRGIATSRATPPGAGPRAPFTDLLVHGADIRLPLGLPFAPEVADAATALAFVSRSPRGFVPKGRLDGIRIAPTDVDEAWGSGAELTGSATDLLLAACGRPVALERISGPGRDLLAARI